MTSLFTPTHYRGQINSEPFSQLFLDMNYEFRRNFNLLTIVYPWALDTTVSFIILTSFYISIEMQIFDIAKITNDFFLSVANRVDKLMWILIWLTRYVQFSSVSQSCPTLCDPMNCSTPGLPVHHRLPEFTQIHVHWISDAISSSVVPFSSCPASESFPVSQLFTWGGQSTGVSVLASFLPKKSQGWYASEWTGWISLQSKGLSRVFSNTTVQKHQFFGAQLSSQSNSHIQTWPLEKP